MPATRAALAAGAALWLLSAMVPVSAQVTLGRLFSTPAERQVLDANRGKAQALAPNSQAQQAAGDATGTGVGAGPGSGPGPGPGESDGLSAKRYSQDGSAPAPAPAAAPGPAGGPGGAAPPGVAASPAAPAVPAAPETLVMNGVLRTSSGRSTVWLNDVPQSDTQNKLSKRGPASPALTVTLPSGKKILLKAGQRYDLNEGRVKDINEP
jgi:hypothetical protein